VATPHNQFEADVVCGRLEAEGIGAVVKRSVGSDVPQLGGGGERYVYVEDTDFERARSVLNAPAPTDDELAEYSEESYRDITGHGSSME